jgi:hypothetical protein
MSGIPDGQHYCAVCSEVTTGVLEFRLRFVKRPELNGPARSCGYTLEVRRLESGADLTDAFINGLFGEDDLGVVVRAHNSIERCAQRDGLVEVLVRSAN